MEKNSSLPLYLTLPKNSTNSTQQSSWGGDETTTQVTKKNQVGIHHGINKVYDIMQVGAERKITALTL